ncbi:unnamed protein product [Candida verbasci]|uniref:MARVEL domain-containing protein n=1 Tax=Candida verbasci TaxID=1227364 RepID=A0A9W4U035_9ASCO|nr:unnamed protein product [Candida verbasci]
MPFTLSKSIVSLSLRGTQLIFSIIVLALCGDFLSEIGFNYDRVTYALVVSILNLLYFAYILVLVPFVFKKLTFSIGIFVAEIIFFIFYLAAMGAIADVMPTDCGSYYYSYYEDSSSTCRVFQAILPFTLFNWLLFGASLTLFVIYSFVPQIRFAGFKSTLAKDAFEFGGIYLVAAPVASATKEVEGEGENSQEEPAVTDAPVVAGDEEANVGIPASSGSEIDKETETTTTK